MIMTDPGILHRIENLTPPETVEDFTWKEPNFGSEDPRDIFGIPEGTEIPSAEVLKIRFRNLAKQYHPDGVGGDDEKMKKINVAYTELIKLRVNNRSSRPDSQNDLENLRRQFAREDEKKVDRLNKIKLHLYSNEARSIHSPTDLSVKNTLHQNIIDAIKSDQETTKYIEELQENRHKLKLIEELRYAKDDAEDTLRLAANSRWQDISEISRYLKKLSHTTPEQDAIIQKLEDKWHAFNQKERNDLNGAKSIKDIENIYVISDEYSEKLESYKKSLEKQVNKVQQDSE